jgi:hypothetical protein
MKGSNNTILLIALIVLLGGFILSRVFRSPSLESNLDENLLSLDTSKISAIHINPAAEKGEIKLVRAGKTWEVQRDQVRARVEASQVKSALESIQEIHPERLVTRKQEKWADYNVDTTGTHVRIFTGQNDPTEFWVGKTSGGGNTMRLQGEDNVYEVKETLETNFNKRFSGWRDKTVLKTDPETVTRVTFDYPSDSSFVLEKINGRWTIDNAEADSTKVTSYLNRFRSQKLSDFADDFKSANLPVWVITLYNNSTKSVELKGWKTDDTKWVVTSSAQPGVFFASDNKSLMTNLFSGKESFVSK